MTNEYNLATTKRKKIPLSNEDEWFDLVYKMTDAQFYHRIGYRRFIDTRKFIGLINFK